uniref:Uncharacterized protein n=1 Tax=Strigamia maritima TaxID=126957 RepID=T1J739_STRMM
MEIYYRKTYYEVKPNIDIMIGTALVITQLALRMICLFTETNGRYGRRYLPETETRLLAAQHTILAGTKTNFQLADDDSPHTESMSDATVNKALDVIEVLAKREKDDCGEQFLAHERIEAGYGGVNLQRHIISHQTQPTNSPRFSTRQQSLQHKRTAAHAAAAAIAGSSSRRDSTGTSAHQEASISKPHFGSKRQEFIKRKRPPVKTIGCVRMDLGLMEVSTTSNEGMSYEEISNEEITTAVVNELKAVKSSSTGRLVADAVAAVAARITANELANVSLTTLPMSSSDSVSLHRLTLGLPSKRKVSTSPIIKEKKHKHNTVPSMTDDSKKKSNILKKSDKAENSEESKDEDTSIPTTSKGKGEKMDRKLYTSPVVSEESNDQLWQQSEVDVDDDSSTATARFSHKSSKLGKESVISYTPMKVFGSKDHDPIPSVRNSIQTAKSFMTMPPTGEHLIDERSGQKNVDSGLLSEVQNQAKCQFRFFSHSDKNLASLSENVNEKERQYLTPQFSSPDDSSQGTSFLGSSGIAALPQGGGGSLLPSDDIPYDRIIPEKPKNKIYYNRLFSTKNGLDTSTSVPSKESLLSSPLDSNRSTVTLTQSAKSSLIISNTGDSDVRFTQTDESLLSFEGANRKLTIQESGNTILSEDQSGESTLTSERSDTRSLSIGDNGRIKYFGTDAPVTGLGSLQSEQKGQNRKMFYADKSNNNVFHEKRTKWYTISTAKTNNIKTSVDKDNLSKQENSSINSPTQQSKEGFYISKESNRDLLIVLKTDKDTASTRKTFVEDPSGSKSCNKRYCSITGTSLGLKKDELTKKAVRLKDCGRVEGKTSFPSTVPGIPNARVFLPGLGISEQNSEISSVDRQRDNCNKDWTDNSKSNGSDYSRLTLGTDSMRQSDSFKGSQLDFSCGTTSNDSKTSDSSVFKVLPGTKSGRHSYPESLPVSFESKTGRSSLPVTLSKTLYGGTSFAGIDRYTEPFPKLSLGNANKGVVIEPEKSGKRDSVSSLGYGLGRFNLRPFSLIQSLSSNSAIGLESERTALEPVSSSRFLSGVKLDELNIGSKNSILKESEDQIESQTKLLENSSGKELEASPSQSISSEISLGESNSQPLNRIKSSEETAVTNDNEALVSSSNGRGLSQIVKSMGFFANGTSLQQAQQSDNMSFSRNAGKASRDGAISITDSTKTSSLSGSLNRQTSSENLFKEQMMKFSPEILSLPTGSETSFNHKGPTQTEESNEYPNSNSQSVSQGEMDLGGSHSGFSRHFNTGLKKRQRQRQRKRSTSNSSSDSSESKVDYLERFVKANENAGLELTAPMLEPSASKSIENGLESEESRSNSDQKGPSQSISSTEKSAENLFHDKGKAIENQLLCTSSKTTSQEVAILIQPQDEKTSSQEGYKQTSGEIIVDKLKNTKSDSSEQSQSQSQSQSQTQSEPTVQLVEKSAITREKAQSSASDKETVKATKNRVQTNVGTSGGLSIRTEEQRRSDSEGFLRRKFSSGLAILIESSSFIPTVPSMRSIIRAPRVFFSNRKLNATNDRRIASPSSMDQMETAVEEVSKLDWVNCNHDRNYFGINSFPVPSNGIGAGNAIDGLCFDFSIDIEITTDIYFNLPKTKNGAKFKISFLNLESICVTHEGGARPPGAAGGPARRQLGGTDEPPRSASGGRTVAESRSTLGRTEGPCNLGLGTTAGLENNEANAMTAFDFQPLVEASEAIPLLGFDFETIVDSRSMSLAELGSADCEYLDEDRFGDELCPIPLLSAVGGGGGGLFQDVQPISSSENSLVSVDTTLVNVNIEGNEDLPASGDGTKTPVDSLLNQDQGKDIPANGLDEVIAAILGLDEVKVGDSKPESPTSGLKSDFSSPTDDAFGKMKSCMKNAVSKVELEALAGSRGEGRAPSMAIDTPTQESAGSDQDKLLYLDDFTMLGTVLTLSHLVLRQMGIAYSAEEEERKNGRSRSRQTGTATVIVTEAVGEGDGDTREEKDSSESGETTLDVTFNEVDPEECEDADLEGEDEEEDQQQARSQFSKSQGAGEPRPSQSGAMPMSRTTGARSKTGTGMSRTGSGMSRTGTGMTRTETGMSKTATGMPKTETSTYNTTATNKTSTSTPKNGIIKSRQSAAAQSWAVSERGDMPSGKKDPSSRSRASDASRDSGMIPADECGIVAAWEDGPLPRPAPKSSSQMSKSQAPASQAFTAEESSISSSVTGSTSNSKKSSDRSPTANTISALYASLTTSGSSKTSGNQSPKSKSTLTSKSSSKGSSKSSSSSPSKSKSKEPSKGGSKKSSKPASNDASREPSQTLSREPSPTLSRDPSKTSTKEGSFKGSSKPASKNASKGPSKASSKVSAQASSKVSPTPSKVGSQASASKASKGPSKGPISVYAVKEDDPDQLDNTPSRITKGSRKVSFTQEPADTESEPDAGDTARKTSEESKGAKDIDEDGDTEPSKSKSRTDADAEPVFSEETINGPEEKISTETPKKKEGVAEELEEEDEDEDAERLGIAYRAVTSYYNTGGKDICNNEFEVSEPSTIDSYQKSRVKPFTQTGLGSPSQASAITNMGAYMPYPTETQTGLPVYDTDLLNAGCSPAMTMPDPNKKSKITSMMQKSQYPGTLGQSGYMMDTTGGTMGEDGCGPEISPSRTVTGPMTECIETANWRSNRGRIMQPSGYMSGMDQGLMSSSGYCSTLGAASKTFPGSAFYTGQTKPVSGPAYMGPQSNLAGYTGLSAYEQEASRLSGIRGTTRQTVNLQSGMVSQMPNSGYISQGLMSQSGGEVHKLKCEFRPSKIPSAYRFPRPDDIPCSNEDFPGDFQSGIGQCGSGPRSGNFTPRASPPRTVYSQRPPTAYSRGPTTNPDILIDEETGVDGGVVSMSQGYQAQLGGVSSGGTYAENTGVGSMPQAASALGYTPTHQNTPYPMSQSQSPQQTGGYPSVPQTGGYPSTQQSGYSMSPTVGYLSSPSTVRASRGSGAYGSVFPTQGSRGSAFNTVPPSQSAYSTARGTSSPMESGVGASRLTTARSAITKDCKPIPAYSCGKACGFDDGPLPRPPKRKSMSTAEDFTKSRAPTRRSQGASSVTPSPSSTDSPEVDCPTNPNSRGQSSNLQSHHQTGTTMMSSSRRSSPQTGSGGNSPQKSQNRQTSGLYSVHASGIRSVSDQDPPSLQKKASLRQIFISKGPDDDPAVVQQTVQAGTQSAKIAPIRKPQRRSTVIEMNTAKVD